MNLLALALTYVRRRALLSFSAVAIALGVAVLFAVLAVLNGFLGELERSIRAFSGDVVVRPHLRRGTATPTLADFHRALAGIQGLAGMEARLSWYGLVGRRGARATADPRATDLAGLLLVGVDDLADPGPGSPPPLRIGDAAARRLGLAPGDILEVVSFAMDADGRPRPVRTSFRVAATFHTGRYDQDLDRALVPRTALARMVRPRLPFGELVLRTAPGTDPEALAGRVEAALDAAGLLDPSWKTVFTWRDLGGNFLMAVENQRGILGTVFFFIVLVAAYQLVATLTLTVAEKRRDIGVLGALGASPGRIAAFFVGLGLAVAATGTLLGLALGWWLSGNLETVEGWIGGGRRIFVPEVYQFDRIPVAVDPASVAILVGATLAAALLFSFLPAWRAARLPVVRALQAP